MHYTNWGGFRVQVSQAGTKRPPYRPDRKEVLLQLRATHEQYYPDEEVPGDEELIKKLSSELLPTLVSKDDWPEVRPPDVADMRDVDEEWASDWAFIEDFLPRREKADGPVPLKEDGVSEPVKYLRSQMNLFVQLARGNRSIIESTLRLLMPLDLLLTIAEGKPAEGVELCSRDRE